MQYIRREQLPILYLENDTESVSMEVLQKVLTRHPSNIVYCESGGKLVGIISTGDILKACRKKQHKIFPNKEFVAVCPGQCMLARNIFLQKEFIHALPVVMDDSTLIGEYSRWDDLVVLEYIFRTDRFCAADQISGQTIAMVLPDSTCPEKQQLFEALKVYLGKRGVEVWSIGYSEVPRWLDVVNVVLIIDEKEFRGCDIILKMMLGEYYERRERLKTYKSILWNVNYCEEQYAAYLDSLHRQGLHVLGLSFDEGIYYECLEKKFLDKYALIGEITNNMVPESMRSDFFDDLYSEEYAGQILQIPFAIENDEGVFKLKDCRSQYYNVAGGERRTINQPEKYGRTIYFFGPCFIYGHYAEDKNTIESFLQKQLSGRQHAVRVVNYGCVGMYDGYMCLPRIATTQLHKGDIVVVGIPPAGVRQIDYLDLNQFVAEHDVNVRWMVNHPMHCGHKVYQLYADAIYKKLEPVLNEDSGDQGALIQQDKNYIKLLYLDQYFKEFDPLAYERIGAIVMNCNPFTYGHRYLIEQALNMVDCLIIFVVEEDKSVFSFVERFVMVCKGVADLKNVKVVPSGPFILSQMSFPEYFVKETSVDITEHTQQDVITFARCIAPRLGIQWRFVGEEPEDGVTEQYNLAMKEILPRYGIELVEIPRRKSGGEYISASAVRDYLEKGELEKLSKLLPETTREQLGL